MTGTLSSKGQITIPKRIRERLGLKAGDRVTWTVTDKGEVKLTPKTKSVLEIGGCLKHLAGKTPVSVEMMKQGIREAAVRSHLKSMGGKAQRKQRTDSRKQSASRRSGKRR
jgi:AbrB family looped-hinge helix DNA binding protein